MRRVSRNVRNARRASTPKRPRPTASSALASLLPAAGTLGTMLGTKSASIPSPRTSASMTRLQHEQRLHAAQHARQRQHRERQDRRADRQGRPAGEREHAAVAEEEPRRREAVEREQRRHRREGGADEHGAGVLEAGADDRQRDRRGRRCERGHADRVEVDAGVELNGCLPTTAISDARARLLRGNRASARAGAAPSSRSAHALIRPERSKAEYLVAGPC